MRLLVLFPLLAALLVPPFAHADDDDDDDREHRGKRHGHRHGGEHGANYKEKFWDGNCKVERKWKDGKYKEKRECDERDSYHQPRAVMVAPPPVVVVPATVVYPPWIVQDQGRVMYRDGQQPQPVGRRDAAVYCQSETVGKVIGGIAGGILGNQIGSGSGRAIATVGGAVAGVLIGGNIGRQIDAGNQACFAKALEFAPAGRRVAWPDAASPRYAVVPGRTEQRGDQYCRHYQADVLGQSGWQKTSGVACRQPDGAWIASR